MIFHHDPSSALRIRIIATVALGLFAGLFASVYAVSRASETTRPQPARSLIRRGPHVSAALQPAAFLAGPPKKARPARSKIIACNRPGKANHVANCKSQDSPAVEPWVIAHGSLVYAAAGDYDSWNGQAGLGFYWSHDGRTWFDAGPLDLFPHDDSRSASGDPQLAADPAGVVYYSSVRFNFSRCAVGGVELARRDPVSGAWRLTQIAANSKTALQDRPALAADALSVYVAWTRFDSCDGEDGPSHLLVALLPPGSAPAAPTTVLDVPGSNFSQGATIGADGRGGFWLAWEEYASASASNGAIELVHWSRSDGWSAARTISPPDFRDLPNPLPGFRFSTDSAPVVAIIKGRPYVGWASSDTGVGRVYLWSAGAVRPVDDSGGDQLLPALAPDGRGAVAVSFSRVDRRRKALGRLLWVGGRTRIVASQPSYPNRDVFFSGRFIGDYAGMALLGRSPLPIWTDLRPSAGTGAATAMTAR